MANNSAKWPMAKGESLALPIVLLANRWLSGRLFYYFCWFFLPSLAWHLISWLVRGAGARRETVFNSLAFVFSQVRLMDTVFFCFLFFLAKKNWILQHGSLKIFLLSKLTLSGNTISGPGQKDASKRDVSLSHPSHRSLVRLQLLSILFFIFFFFRGGFSLKKPVPIGPCRSLNYE